MSNLQRKLQPSLEKSLTKQEYVVGDATGCCRLVVWEMDIDCLLSGNCYQLKNVNVRQYKGTKYLSIGKECEILNIEDIGDVIDLENPIDDSDATTRTMEAEIVGAWWSQYKGCASCKTKIETMMVL